MNGEDSNDECCVCGDRWTEGQQGWVLCDSQGCENTVCKKCTYSLELSVSELFFCPSCAGSGQSAAATAGGAVATAVAACTALEKLPLSFKAVLKILTNLQQHPNESKFRKLRLENKSVRSLCDLEPVLNILTSVGFIRTEAIRQKKKKDTVLDDLPPTEEVLSAADVQTAQVDELLQILNGLSPGESADAVAEKEDGKDSSHASSGEKKREASDKSEGDRSKKQKADDA